MQITNRDIYKKTIQVIRSCKNKNHIKSARRYVELAIIQIKLEKKKPASTDLMVYNLEHYLRIKKRTLL